MNESDLATLSTQVLWAALAVSMVFGATAQRLRFCTMGAIADVVQMGDWLRARMWALAIATAVLGFNTMVGLGWVDAHSSLYAGPRLMWLSSIAGGALFGVGMVLASGCGSKNLVRLGGGNLKSLVVLLVLGISAFATLRGITGVLRVATIDRVFVELPGGQDLPSWLAARSGLARSLMAVVSGALVAAGLIAWVLRRPEGRTAETWIGGVGIGACIVAMWWVSGRLGFVPEDPTTLEPAFLATNSRRMESMSMVAPVAYSLDWLMFYSDQSKHLTIGIVSMVGVTLGAFVAAVSGRDFRWEGFGGVEDLGNHLVGGILMGVGGVLALGCTVGQGLSGVSTLSLGSVLAVGGIVAGAVAALRYQAWRIDRMA
jgi:uncharacterized membrane protein YedE/YeeE